MCVYICVYKNICVCVYVSMYMHINMCVCIYNIENTELANNSNISPLPHNQVATGSEKWISVTEAIEKTNCVPFLVYCLKRRAHKMCMNLVTKMVYNFPSAHIFFFGPNVVFCTLQEEFKRGSSYSRLHRNAALADVLDLAAPCLQGFLGNFIVEVGDLLLKQN